MRLVLHWVDIAPHVRPANAADHLDPAYNWPPFDAQVRAAKARGLAPFVTISIAPTWATNDGAGGSDHVTRPSPSALAEFARAAATRFDGTYTPPGASSPLPAVRIWEIWNEPNRDYFLMPQYGSSTAGPIVSANWYRTMLAQAGAAVRSVNDANQVVAGNLAPRGKTNKPAPLAFMRQLLCVSKTYVRTCDLRSNPVRMDIWAHHPYTTGGPSHVARARDDVVISGLPKMRRLLEAAVRLGQVQFGGPITMWATEFGWDTKPPDPEALPMWLHARWTAEALYRMWSAGVAQVTWWRVQDDPLAETAYQSGFFTVGGTQKLSLKAFRFPTVGFRTSAGIKVWGRTPLGSPGTVRIYLKVGGTWRRIGTLATNAGGVFRRTYRVPYLGSSVQAHFGTEKSLSFSLTPVPDRTVVPMGCGGAAACG